MVLELRIFPARKRTKETSSVRRFLQPQGVGQGLRAGCSRQANFISGVGKIPHRPF